MIKLPKIKTILALVTIGCGLTNTAFADLKMKQIQTLPQDVQMQAPAATQPVALPNNLPVASPAANLPQVNSPANTSIKMQGPASTVTDTLKLKCHTPAITEVIGNVTPGARITVKGNCFGQYKPMLNEVHPSLLLLSILAHQTYMPAGTFNIVSWNDDSIIATVPSVSAQDEGEKQASILLSNYYGQDSYSVIFNRTSTSGSISSQIGTSIQMQKAPMALPQTSTPATPLPANGVTPAAKPIGNFGAAKVIQFNRNANIDLQNESDSTVLAGPNGEKITIGELKRKLNGPAPSEITQQLNAGYVDTSASSDKYVVKNKAFSLPAKTFDVSDVMVATNTTNTNKKNKDANIKNQANNSVAATLALAPSCEKESKIPEVTKIYGTFTPGSKVRIFGSCFQDANRGQVRLTGPTIKGSIILEPISWNGRFIAATVPAVSGATEGKAELQVVTAEGRRSIEKNVDFVPSYEHFGDLLQFTGCKDLHDSNNEKVCSTASFSNTSHHFTGTAFPHLQDKARPATSAHEVWGITINRACQLDEIRLRGFTRFKPDFSAEVRTFSGTAYISGNYDTSLEQHWYGDTIWYYGGAAVSASAYCPTGILPY